MTPSYSGPSAYQLDRFELPTNKPDATLAVMRSSPQGWMDIGRTQWQLQLSLPAHRKGQTIGFSVVGQPVARAGQMVPVRSREDLVCYKAAMKLRSLETQRGRWDELVYTLLLGVDTNTAIKLELGYMGGMVQQKFIFKGSGNSNDPIILDTSSGELSSMPALIVGKQGNKKLIT